MQEGTISVDSRLSAIEITWRKQCNCKGTASGPRIVRTDSEGSYDGVFRFTFKVVPIACDVCNKPWGR